MPVTARTTRRRCLRYTCVPTTARMCTLRAWMPRSRHEGTLLFCRPIACSCSAASTRRPSRCVHGDRSVPVKSLYPSYSDAFCPAVLSTPPTRETDCYFASAATATRPVLALLSSLMLVAALALL